MVVYFTLSNDVAKRNGWCANPMSQEIRFCLICILRVIKNQWEKSWKTEKKRSTKRKQIEVRKRKEGVTGETHGGEIKVIEAETVSDCLTWVVSKGVWLLSLL